MSRFDKVIAEQRQVTKTMEEHGLLESQIRQRREELEEQCLKEICNQLPEFIAVFPEIKKWDEMYLCYKAMFGKLKQKKVNAIGFVNLNTKSYDLYYYSYWHMLEDGTCYHLSASPQGGYDPVKVSESFSEEEMIRMICRCLPWVMYDKNYKIVLEEGIKDRAGMVSHLKDRFYQGGIYNDAKVDILVEMFEGNAEEAVFRYFSCLLNGRV